MKPCYNVFLDILLKLKLDFYALGLKIELENDYSTQKDNDFLHELAVDSKLDLGLKIGGCGSVCDLYLAQKIRPQIIIAPMIESIYALEKFYETASYLCDLSTVKLFFNLETIQGYQNLKSILNSQYIKYFEGIVFGRNDFCSSLPTKNTDVDSNLILNYVNDVAQQLNNSNLDLIVGGIISNNSKEFLQSIRSSSYTKFETRKIVFDKNLVNNGFEQGLNLALQFEKLWLEAKEHKTNLDEQRMTSLLKRLG